jgi:hypothetical protein
MRLTLATLTMAALLGSAPAAAQMPGVTGPALPSEPQPAASEAPAQATLSVEAVFSSDGKPIRSGVTWRVFEDRADVAPALVGKSDAPSPSFALAPGSYIVHAAYGFASASKRVRIEGRSTAERVTITAGALKLAGVIGDAPIPASRLSFSIYVPIGSNSEGRLVLAKARAGGIVRLPEGMYHVVSTYGDSNAIMRADLRVEAGRVTEAVLNHRAATVTLKLVASAGGEAFAGTAFSVLTPGGDVIREAIGAFPSVTLAEGDYVLIARHEGQVYTREFKVESGLNRDVEIVATP